MVGTPIAAASPAKLHGSVPEHPFHHEDLRGSSIRSKKAGTPPRMRVRFRQVGADESGMREPTLIQQPLAMRIYCLLFGLLVVGTMVPSAIRSGPDGILILLFVAVGVTFIARVASLRVLADESGLHVRNFFRTQHFRGDEVEDFRLGRPMGGLPFGWAIHVLLRNEEVVTLDVAVYSWSLAFGSRVKREQVLNGLRQWLPPRN
jgi:hypothetical protein